MHTNKCISELYNDELITVGPDDGQPTYQIQKTTLLDASPYFVNALKGEFQEASERRVRLPGADAITLKLLVYWLRRCYLPSFADELEGAKETKGGLARETRVDVFMLLVKVWVLADELIMPNLQNAAMHQLLEVIKANATPIEVIREGYVISPSSSKMRDLLVVEARWEYFTGQTISDADLHDLASIPGFVVDFVSVMAAGNCGMDSACSSSPHRFLVAAGNDGEEAVGDGGDDGDGVHGEEPEDS